MASIAFISDIHDNQNNLETAVEEINRRAPEFTVFLGDLCSPFTLSQFEALKNPLKGVFGNNDGDRQAINKRLKPLNTRFSDFLDFDFHGISFGCYHGTDPGILREMRESPKFDVIASGHTHRHEVNLKDGVLCINPGEICGYLTGNPTFMMFELEKKQPELVSLFEIE